MIIEQLLSDLPRDRQIAILDVAANAEFRNLLVQGVMQLNTMLSNLAPPAEFTTEGTIEFTQQYKTLQRERQVLEEIIRGLQHIHTQLATGDNS